MPGWPYSFVAVFTSDRTSWTQVRDAVRLGPVDDAAAVTTGRLRDVVERLVAAGQWQRGDRNILAVMDAGYDVCLAWVLRDLPVELVGRLRSDRVLRRPAPSLKEYAQSCPRGGRPPRHGKEFSLARPASWPRALCSHGERHGPLRQGRDPRLGPDASQAAAAIRVDRPRQ
ncbi:transposase [Streptomyces sp. NBC_00414]